MVQKRTIDSIINDLVDLAKKGIYRGALDKMRLSSAFNELTNYLNGKSLSHI